MRLEEIRKYDPQIYKDPQAEKIVRFILGHCSEWIRAAGTRTVWRGVNRYKYMDADSFPQVFTRKVRPNRRVKDSNPKYHALYNKLIRLAGGAANRTNSMFVTGNPNLAEGYGIIYAVFPMGPFQYTWSPEWEDWYSANEEEMGFEGLFKVMKTDVKDRIVKNAGTLDPNQMYEFPNNLFNINSYDPVKVKDLIVADRDLQKGISTGAEIMILCSEAIYIEEDYYKNVIFPMLRTVVDNFPNI